MKMTTMIMRLVAVAAFACAIAHGAEDGGEDKVLVLTDETFDSTVAEHPLVLVEFFAPWCGHCKALAPEYAAASITLDEKGEAGKLASVDCTEWKDLCSKYGVRGFPTVKLFRNDGSEPSDYDQARKADAIVKFMVKQNQPAVVALESEDGVASFAEGESVKVIAYAKEGTDLETYGKAAAKLRNEYSFASVVTTGDEKIVVARDFDEGDVTFEGSFSDETLEDDLITFIKAQSFPVVGEIGPENYAKYLERGFPFVWVFVDTDSEEQTAIVKDIITPVAATARDALSFVTLDGVKWGEHAKSFGLSGSTPGIAIEDRDAHKNYLFPEGDDVTKDAFAEFVAKYRDGTLVANVKSEPEPEQATDDNGVTTLVGTTFESIVLDSTKDVLVEFYAPWCGHCKSLAPKYDELGKQYAGDDNIVVAKIDATANDAPADVSGFPTLIFYPASDDGTTVDYSGARTAEAMAEFIEKNRKSSPAAAAGGDDSHDEL